MCLLSCDHNHRTNVIQKNGERIHSFLIKCSPFIGLKLIQNKVSRDSTKCSFSQSFTHSFLHQAFTKYFYYEIKIYQKAEQTLQSIMFISALPILSHLVPP